MYIYNVMNLYLRIDALNPPSVSTIPSPEMESDSRCIFKTVILTEVFISEARVSLYIRNTAGNLPWKEKFTRRIIKPQTREIIKAGNQ